MEEHILDFVFSVPARIFSFLGIWLTLADPHFLKKLHLGILSLGNKVAFLMKIHFSAASFFQFQKKETLN